MLIRAEDVLERYPMSMSTLNRLVRDGRLRCYRIAGGRLRYFDEADVAACFVRTDGS